MSYKWFQNNSTLTISFPISPNLTKNNIDIIINSTSIKVGIKGKPSICEVFFFFKKKLNKKLNKKNILIG